MATKPDIANCSPVYDSISPLIRDRPILHIKKWEILQLNLRIYPVAAGGREWYSMCFLGNLLWRSASLGYSNNRVDIRQLHAGLLSGDE